MTQDIDEPGVVSSPVVVASHTHIIIVVVARLPPILNDNPRLVLDHPAWRRGRRRGRHVAPGLDVAIRVVPGLDGDGHRHGYGDEALPLDDDLPLARGAAAAAGLAAAAARGRRAGLDVDGDDLDGRLWLRGRQRREENWEGRRWRLLEDDGLLDGGGRRGDEARDAGADFLVVGRWALEVEALLGGDPAFGCWRGRCWLAGWTETQVEGRGTYTWLATQVLVCGKALSSERMLVEG